MKPAFALSLSFDGIVLLHRAAGGWRRAGTVAPDSPDLSAALAGLREIAARLEPDGLSCKLIIPNDQIRYLSIDTGMADPQTRDHRVRDALEGATPYAVDDLVFDLSVEGSKTHIAAVARETLAEAEGFAAEHQFNPLCFVAIPGDQAFLGEPFFGPSRHAASVLPKGQRVEADGIAVVVVGAAEIPPAPIPPGVGVTDGHLPDGPVPSAPPVVGFASRRGKPPTERTPRPVPVPVPMSEHGEPVRAEPSESQIPTPVIAAPRAGTELPAATELSGTLRATPPVAAARRAASKVRPLAPAMPAKLAAAISQTNNRPDEAERLTVFGARQGAAMRGKPRHLGLILTAVLLLLLAGIAAWASIFLDDPIARLLGRSTPTEIAAAPEPVAAPVAPQPVPKALPAMRQATVLVQPQPQPQPKPSPSPGNVEFALPDFAAPKATNETALAGPIEAEEPVATAKLGPGPRGLSDADATAPNAPRTPEPRTPAVIATAPQVDRQETLYAATGIWQTAPQEPDTPTLIGLSDLFIGSIDNRDLSRDAVALPDAQALLTDLSLTAVAVPTAHDARFDLDARGLVKPTPGGALNPQGVMVYLGRPAVVPPKIPARNAAQSSANPALERLAGRRPRLRPGNLAEQSERSQFGGLTRQELAGMRPKARPASDQAAPEPAPVIDESATAQAVASSRRPSLRPVSFASLAIAPAPSPTTPDTASQPDQPAQTGQPGHRAGETPDRGRNGTEVASISPRTIKPKVPSPTSVTRQATVKNAINLRQVNLIGVYGSPSNRRALVRLPSGRYKKVKVGDSLDGGRIVAIGDSELRYQKGGRNVLLKVPSS